MRSLPDIRAHDHHSLSESHLVMARFPSAATEFLRCPHCQEGLVEQPGSLVCSERHRFDFAKQGYVPLLSRNANVTTSDNAVQVAARELFLNAGFYDPVREAIAKAAHTPAAGCLVEPGCGTGFYLAGVLEKQPLRLGIGLDTSKYALRRAARSHQRAAAVLADAWKRMPLADNCAAVVLNVFAPRNGAEIARVLRADGHLVVVTPEAPHLGELVTELDLLTVDPSKPQRLEQTLGKWFRLTDTKRIDYQIHLSTEYIEALVLMGPSARHLDKDHLHSILSAEGHSRTVTVSVTVTTWKT